MFRSFSDVESGRVRTTQLRNNLEANCNEIFNRTPAVTKEMLQKLQNSGPKRAVICGYELNPKQISVLLALFLLFVLSSGIAGIFWGTDMYRAYIRSTLAISDKSEHFERWLNPSTSYLKVYIFNYTNVDDVEAGYTEKLHVEELGPYVYRERIERFNYEFSEDETTIRYQESHEFDFVPELSGSRRQYDRIQVPNIPVFAAAAMSKNSYYLTKLAMSNLMRAMKAKAFLNIPAHEFIFGYDDNFFDLARGVLALSNPLPFDKFGLLAVRKGVLKDTIEIYTGKDDINKLGIIKKIGQKTKFDTWHNSECNRITGIDGVMVPPLQVANKLPVPVLMKDFCRHYSFEYEKEVPILNDTVMTYRYVLPEDSYDHPNLNPQNQGYCDISGECPLQGLLNNTKCAYGTPMFISFPHFYKGDPQLLNSVTGLNPNPKYHQTYFDVHPLGFMTQGWNRLQINIQAQKSFGISQLTAFDDGQIVPVAWVEIGQDAANLPDNIKKLFYEATYMVNGIELIMSFGSLLTSFVTFLAILLVIRGNYCRNINKTSPHRSPNGEVRLI